MKSSFGGFFFGEIICIFPLSVLKMNGQKWVCFSMLLLSTTIEWNQQKFGLNRWTFTKFHYSFPFIKWNILMKIIFSNWELVFQSTCCLISIKLYTTPQLWKNEANRERWKWGRRQSEREKNPCKIVDQLTGTLNRKAEISRLAVGNFVHWALYICVRRRAKEE